MILYHPESDEYLHSDAPRPLCETISAHQMPLGTQLQIGGGISTVLADLDFETYSEAGLVMKEGKWKSPDGGNKKGLSLVGTVVYSEHPSTEVLSLAYDLKDGKGHRLWLPNIMPLPQDLFDHIAKGGLLEAWNSAFEYYIWNNVCVPKYGFPPLHYLQLRDAMAKARAFSLPGALGNAAKVLNTGMQKMAEGKRLLNKFSLPRNVTKTNPQTRNLLHEHPVDSQLLYDYNIMDIKTEASLSALIPDLPPEELEFWLNTQKGNIRGIGVRPDELDACISILDQAYEKYNAELTLLTEGQVTEASKVAQLQKWCATQGYPIQSLDDDIISEALNSSGCPLHVKRALEIRRMIGSAGVKKVYAMKNMASKSNRLNELFIYHGARTGRDTGAAVQPQNLVKAGPKLNKCTKCGHIYGVKSFACTKCHNMQEPGAHTAGWSWEAVDEAIEHLKSHSLEHVESLYGDAVLTISGCVRGLLVAAPGHKLISSDYSAIEAVVAACLAGEQWRIDAFKAKRDIYLVSASAITKTPYEEYIRYYEETGSKHPDRQKIGKVAELALGYAGWISAWRNFDDTDMYTDDEVKGLILKWKDASPAIVEMWGGQVRGKPWAPDYTEYYGLEGAAIQAISCPGQAFTYRHISYLVHEDILFCRLPSGRTLKYHQPRLTPSSRWEGQVEISFMGWNSNPQMGPIGWVRIQTFGGRLFENCIAKGTKVITEKGLMNIEDITSDIKVFDGVEFVNQEGFRYNGEQQCTQIDGVYMTLDHEVLTDEGWVQSKEQPRPYRSTLWDAYNKGKEPFRWQKMVLALPLRLREYLREKRERSYKRHKERENFQLRMFDSIPNRGQTKNARAIPASGLWSMEGDVGPMPATLSSSMAQLRSAWNSCMRELAGGISELLGRHGRYLSKWLGDRPHRQQRELRADKLPLGSEKKEYKKQKEQSDYADSVGYYYGSRSIREVRNKCDDASISTKDELGPDQLFQDSRLVKKAVGDLINCGPRNRFVVIGESGPFIVHNCVQAVSRDVLRDAVNKLERAGYNVVMRIHDEVVCEVPEDFGSVEELEAIMGDLPAWAEGWPIRAAGGWVGQRFRKD